ncbi:MAG: hypothetical protein ACI81R_003045 [Bradymonadia bacterium]
MNRTYSALPATLLGLTLLAACGVDSDDDGQIPPADASADTTGDAAGDAGADAAADSNVESIAPSLEFLLIENPAMKLGAILTISSSIATTVEIEARDVDGVVVWSQSVDSVTEEVEVNAFGFRAQSSYSLTATATTEDGGSDSVERPFTTAELPDDLPTIMVNVSQPDRMAAGYTLFSVFRWLPDADSGWGYLLAVDNSGEVVWFYRADHRIQDARLLANGTIIYDSNDEAAYRIDLSGNVLENWTDDVLGIGALHHEMFPLPNGNYATLGAEVMEDFGPYLQGDSEVVYDVVGDLIVEFTPAGEVVHRYSLFDIFDPLTDRTDLFNTTSWDTHFELEGSKDWSHGNAIIHDPSDDTFIISLRHMHALVKIDRTTGDLVWRMGPGQFGDFSLAGDAAWQYAQHAPEITGENRILLFDNGNARPIGGGETPYTRAVEFEYIAPTESARGSVTQRWEYRADESESHYAPFLGDADLIGDTVLITEGGLTSDASLTVGDAANIKSARIREVTYTDAPEVVFEIVLSADPEAGIGEPTGYSVYRSERISTLGSTE